MKNPSIKPLTRLHQVVVLCAFLFLLAIGARAQSVTDGATPSGLAPGSPAGSYALSGFENVNLFNGSLDVHVPLLTVGGRGEAVAAVAVGVNPEPWIMKGTGVWQDWWTTLKPGYGPGVLQGRRIGVKFEGAGQSCSQDGLYHYQWTRTTLTFISSDGTEYDLRDKQTGGQWIDAGTYYCSTGPSRGTEFVTGDGTSATFISDATIIDRNRYAPTNIEPIIFPSGYLTLRSGIKYHIVNGLVMWVRDRNGNMLNFTYGSNSGDPLTYRKVLSATDSLARTVTFQYFTLYDTISFKGFGGAPRTITINRAELHTVFRGDFLIQGSCQQSPGVYWPGAKKPSELFPGVTPWPGETCYNRMVISSIVLPGGLSYQFKYNPYGEVARIETPTGSAIEYDMTPGSGLVFGEPVPGEEQTQIYRSVQARRVYVSKNDTLPKSLMTYTAGPATGDAFMIVDQLDPQDNNKILTHDKHYFHGNPVASLFVPGPKGAVGPGYPAFNEGRERITESYSVVNGVVGSVLRKTETLWEFGPAIVAGAPACNARVKEITSTLADTNQVTKKVFGYDDSVPYNNQNNIKEYDFGNGVAGALLRETSTTFITSSAYTNVGLLSLPEQVWVYNGGVTLLASIKYEYDNYTASLPHGALTPRTSISGFDSSFDTNYLTRGNLTGTTRYLMTNGVVPNCLNSPAQCVSTYAQYDVAGNTVKTIDALGFPTEIDYTDRFGTPNEEAQSNPGPTDLSSQSSFAFATKVTNALGHTTYTQFDYYLGKPVNFEDANGIVGSSSYDLDPLDRPKLVKQAIGTLAEHHTTFDYNDTARIITTTSDLDAVDDGKLVSKLLYDQMGRPTEKQQFEGGTNYIAVQTQYDPLGRAYKTSNPFRSWQSETAIWTTSAFDALGRMTSVTTADSATVNSYYSGSQVLVKDQMGKERMSQTNGLGQLTDVWEITSANDSTESISFPNHSEVTAGYRTKYAYDTLGNLVTVTQQKGTAGTTQTRNFVYDSLSRLTDATNPESGHIVYDYDANGNLLHKTDARLVTTTYDYDALNRNKTIDYSDTTGVNPDITRLYDGAANGKGRLWESYAGGSASVGNNVEHTKVTTYDALGRPLSQLQEFKTNGVWSSPYTTQRSYNLAGGVRSQTYPSGKIVAYSYDNAGRTSSFTGYLGDGTYHAYSTEIIYSPLGGMTKEKFGTDTALYNKLFYNSRGQLAEIREGTTYTGPNDTGWERGAIINYYGDCWGMCGGSNSTTPMTNNNGNLKKQEIFVPGANSWLQQYDYDNLNRLGGVSESVGSTTLWRQEYVYDRYGNRTIHQTNTWGPTSGPLIPKPNFELQTSTNRLYAPGDLALSETQRVMQYDGAGNLKKDKDINGAAVTRVYDGENRMTSETRVDTSVAGSYSYNADGQRVRRKVNGVETWQVYGMEGELLAEYAANTAAGSPQKEYGYRNGQLLITATVAVAGWGAPPSFTPPAFLVSGGDIKLEHLTELRTAVNQLRSHAGLAAASFTVDPNPERYVTSVRADHILQLRTALEGARTQLGLSTGGYAHPGLHATDFIFAIDFQELRDQILSAWNSGGTAGGVEWLVADQLGTPRMVFDQTGALNKVKRHDYLPFGEEILAGTGGRTTGQGYVADNVRQKYTLKERDIETGLDFFEARYYASTQGRFTSPDPLQASAKRRNPQTWNRYTYGLNNPLRFTDPEGEEPEDVYLRTKTKTTEITVQERGGGQIVQQAKVTVTETQTEYVNAQGGVIQTDPIQTSATAANTGNGAVDYSTDQLKTMAKAAQNIVEVSREKGFDATIALGIAQTETHMTSLSSHETSPAKQTDINPMQLSGTSGIKPTTDLRSNIAGAIDVYNRTSGSDLNTSLQTYNNQPGRAAYATTAEGHINRIRSSVQTRTAMTNLSQRPARFGFPTRPQ